MIDDGHLLERQAKPEELCADRQEVPAPAVCRIDHGRVKPFLVDERHCQLTGIDFAGAYHIVDQTGHTQAVFAG